jgi:hypothetical protein
VTTPNNATYASLILATRDGTPRPAGWTVVNVAPDPSQVEAGLVAGAYVNTAGQVVITFVGPSTSLGFAGNHGAGTAGRQQPALRRQVENWRLPGYLLPRMAGHLAERASGSFQRS